MNPSPNIFKFLRWFCPEHLVEEIEGDLIQKYEKDIYSVGRFKALVRLWWRVVLFFRPGILLRNKLTRKETHMVMLTHYLRFTNRVIFRNKLFTALNISGLSIGLGLCFLMVNFVLYEQSYDKFLPNSDRLARVTYEKFIDNEFQYSRAQVFPGIAEAMNELPEVEMATRVFPFGTHIDGLLSPIKDGPFVSFMEPRIFAVDSSFLKILSYPMLYGDPSTALKGKGKMVITEKMAMKYFGTTDVVNRTIQWVKLSDWTITGVLRDPPENGHFKFDFLVSDTKVYGDGSLWNWDGFYTYILLKPGTDLKILEEKLQKLLVDKVKPFQPQRMSFGFHLQPVRDIHLQSQLTGELEQNGNSEVNDVLLLTAAFVLVLAFVNYLNLSLARIVRRAREVGVRQVIGSSSGQLRWLFATETFGMLLISTILAVGLFYLGSPTFETLIGRTVEKIIFERYLYVVWVVPALMILLSFVAGMYPVQMMTLAGPAWIMKGNVGAFRRPGFEKVLLGIQFAITITLISCTAIVWCQVNFMQGKDLGFSLDEKIVIRTMSPAGAEMDTLFVKNLKFFREKIGQASFVLGSTVTSNIPGRENEWIGRLARVQKEGELITTVRTRVDPDFLKVYGVTLAEGRNFENDNPQYLLINETAVKLMGFKNNAEAVGSTIMRDHTIIGVVHDFHERSLLQPMAPSLYSVGQGYMKFITVRLNGADPHIAINFMRDTWASVFPGTPFEFYFLNDYFNTQYKQEETLGKVTTAFSLLGLTVACIGLFGFTYFMVHQRIKELGIRKVLGASAISLFRLLAAQLAWLWFIAACLSTIVVYWLSNDWLSRFPYRIEVDSMLLVLPAAATAAILLTTVASLLVRSIRRSPVEALKSE